MVAPSEHIVPIDYSRKEAQKIATKCPQLAPAMKPVVSVFKRTSPTTKTHAPESFSNTIEKVPVVNKNAANENKQRSNSQGNCCGRCYRKKVSPVREKDASIVKEVVSINNTKIHLRKLRR